MTYAPTPSNTQRATGIVAVVILHVIIIWAFANGFLQRVVATIKAPVEARLIKEQKLEKVEAPPAPKLLALPPPTVIMPEIDVAPPDTPSGTGLTGTVGPGTPSIAAHAPVTVLPHPDRRRAITDPPYPPTSIRLCEEGLVELLLTVNERGKVTAAEIATTSGHDRLDQAAIAEAVSNWWLAPGTIDGKPAAMQVKMRVRFKIDVRMEGGAPSSCKDR